MNILVTALHSIPDVIWSGIIASLLTLGGVLVSNRSNTNRLLLQLKHDATEKAKERTAALRRDVYLRTVEELVKANAHLASLPQMDLSKVNLGEGLQGFFSAAARLQLVAEPNTALLVNKLVAQFGELVFELMTHLLPASKAKTDIQIADDLYSKVQIEVNRILADMAKQNETGKPDLEVFQALQTSFKFQQSQFNKYAGERDDAWTRFNSGNIAFQRFLLTQLRDIGSKQIPVLIEIRRDLGLTGDLRLMEEQMQLQWNRMEEKFNALIGSLGDA